MRPLVITVDCFRVSSLVAEDRRCDCSVELGDYNINKDLVVDKKIFDSPR